MATIDGNKKKLTVSGEAIENAVNSINAINKVNTVDLVLFMGQSNMSGQGEDATKATVLEDGEGYEFRAVSDPTKLYKAVEPFGITENNDAITDTQTGGMITSIMKSYYRDRKVPIVGVLATCGGSGIDQWQPNTTFYNEAVRRANLAKTWLINNGYVIEHILLVYCQGEHEARIVEKNTFNYWKPMIDNIVIGLKKDVGIEKCFMIRIGNVIGDNNKFANMIEIQTNICKYYSDYILLTTKLSEMNDRGLMRTKYHYIQSAYNEIGLDAGKNLAFYINNNKEPYMYDYQNDNLYYSFETNRGYIINVKGISLDKNTLNIGVANKTYGDNLFNSSNYDNSHFTDDTNIVSNTSYPYVVSSNYIEVEGGKTYELSHNNITNMGIWFDENRNAISSFEGKKQQTNNVPVTLKAPDNAKYIKFNININKIQLENVYLKKVTITNKTYGDNLFNSSNYDSSHYTDGTNIVSNTDYQYIVSSDYIEVEGGKSYELSHNNITNMGIWFDENRNAISSFEGKKQQTNNVPVTLKAPDNAKYIKFNININKIQLENVYLKKVTITGISTLVATITPENATNKNVTFTSSDETKVTIDNNGVVIGVAEGTATITVTTEDGNFTDTCAVTVSTS